MDLASDHQSKYFYASSNTKVLKKFNIKRKKLVYEYLTFPTGGWINKMTISKDDSYLFAGTFEGHLLQVCLKTDTLYRDWGRIHHNWITCMEISPDNQSLFCGSWDGALTQWSIPNERIKKNLEDAHEGPICDMIIRPCLKEIDPEILNCDTMSTDDDLVSHDIKIKRLKSI